MAQKKTKPFDFAEFQKIYELPETVVEIEVDRKACSFTLRALGGGAWRALVKEHPPTKEHTEAGLDFNAETFPPAVLVACSVDPELNLEQATWLVENLPLQQFETLWTSAFLLCVNGRTSRV